MKQPRTALLLVSIALAIALCWPICSVFWFESHESNEYVTRTVEYAAALARGDLYPRWAPDLYGGYGSPFFNFYAPVVYWLGGLFTHLVGSPVLALKLVMVVSTCLAGAFCFLLVQLETDRSDAALLASVLYLTAPYRLCEATWRGDLAEQCALGMLPMALFAFRRIAREPELARLPRLAWLAALAHAALVMSHTLLGLWGTGIVAVVALLSLHQCVRSGAREQGWSLALAFLGGLSISALYTLPAILEKKLVRTETMVVSWAAPQNNPLKWSQLYESGPHQTLPLLLLALVALVTATIVRRRLARRAAAWWAGAMLLVGLTLSIASPLWAANVIPFGAFIQFPWRLLGPAALCAAVATGIVWPALIPSRLVSSLLVLPIALAALLMCLRHTTFDAMKPEQVLLSTERIRSRWIKGTVLDEYLPRSVARNSGAPAQVVAKSQADTSVRVLESAGTSHRLQLDVRVPATLTLQLHHFPGWEVRTERGPRAAELIADADGLVALRLPAAGQYDVQVRFGSTPVRRLAMSAFWLGVLGLWPAAWLLSGGRRRRTAPARPSFAPVEVP